MRGLYSVPPRRRPLVLRLDWSLWASFCKNAHSQICYCTGIDRHIYVTCIHLNVCVIIQWCLLKYCIHIHTYACTCVCSTSDVRLHLQTGPTPPTTPLRKQPSSDFLFVRSLGEPFPRMHESLDHQRTNKTLERLQHALAEKVRRADPRFVQGGALI